MIILSLLVGFVCIVSYSYRVLTDNAFVTSKYNSGLTRGFLVLGIGFTIVAAILALLEKVG
jgi:hypothetical protein